MKIVLIRHGQSSANVANVLGGQTDYDLTRNGIIELEQFKMNINYPKTEEYHVSDLQRAVKTANILYGNKEFKFNQNLREIDFGDDDGKEMEGPSLMKYVKNWLHEEEVKTGESFNQFHERVKNEFFSIVQKAQENNKKSLTIISHAGVMRVILYTLGIHTKENYFENKMLNGLGYIIDLETNEMTAIKEEF